MLFVFQEDIMSQKEFIYTRGPLKVSIIDHLPFHIITTDESDRIVFIQAMPCYSSKDKCVDDVITCRNMDVEIREACSQLNKKAIADARLRAAAPDMIDALIDIYSKYEYMDKQWIKTIIEHAAGMKLDEAIEAREVSE
jgi:hypothetical protein